jgi:hypothetical protein
VRIHQSSPLIRMIGEHIAKYNKRIPITLAKSNPQLGADAVRKEFK